eukprot:scaffold53155_cov56-Phaeocystis_antarctica.AAC.2
MEFTDASLPQRIAGPISARTPSLDTGGGNSPTQSKSKRVDSAVDSTSEQPRQNLRHSGSPGRWM